MVKLRKGGLTAYKNGSEYPVDYVSQDLSVYADALEAEVRERLTGDVLFMGDSYCFSPDERYCWPFICYQRMSALPKYSASSFYGIYAGGAGFVTPAAAGAYTKAGQYTPTGIGGSVTPGTFEEMLTAIFPSANNAIKEVYVFAGYNDLNAGKGAPAEGVASAVTHFVQTEKERFPKAEIHIGMSSVSDINAMTLSALNTLTDQYREGCLAAGGIFHEGVNKTLRTRFLADQIHPNDRGVGLLTNAIYNSIVFGQSPAPSQQILYTGTGTTATIPFFMADIDYALVSFKPTSQTQESTIYVDHIGAYKSGTLAFSVGAEGISGISGGAITRVIGIRL